MITEVEKKSNRLILGGLGGLHLRAAPGDTICAVLDVAHAIVPWAKFLPGLLALPCSGWFYARSLQQNQVNWAGDADLDRLGVRLSPG